MTTDIRKALEALLDRYTGLVNSGDAGNWDPEAEDFVINARAALAIPPGWQIVPVEPTPEMVLGVLESDSIDWIGQYNLPKSIYAAMLKASPKP